MKTYILVLIIRSVGITSIDQPGAYGLEACNAAGQEAADNSKDSSEIRWTCVPRQ